MNQTAECFVPIGDVTSANRHIEAEVKWTVPDVMDPADWGADLSDCEGERHAFRAASESGKMAYFEADVRDGKIHVDQSTVRW